METKQLQLVTFEQAQKLKQLGFDWLDNNLQIYREKQFKGYLMNGSAIWDEDEKVIPDNEWFHAPTVALALKWLRDEKKIWIYPTQDTNRNYHSYCMVIRNEQGILNMSRNIDRNEIELGESAGLDYALDYLLKTL